MITLTIPALNQSSKTENLQSVYARIGSSYSRPLKPTSTKAVSLGKREKLIIQLLTAMHGNNIKSIELLMSRAESHELSDVLLDRIIGKVPLENQKLEVFVSFVRQILEKNAIPADLDVSEFINAGFNYENFMDIILIISEEQVKQRIKNAENLKNRFLKSSDKAK